MSTLRFTITTYVLFIHKWTICPHCVLQLLPMCYPSTNGPYVHTAFYNYYLCVIHPQMDHISTLRFTITTYVLSIHKWTICPHCVLQLLPMCYPSTNGPYVHTAFYNYYLCVIHPQMDHMSTLRFTITAYVLSIHKWTICPHCVLQLLPMCYPSTNGPYVHTAFYNYCLCVIHPQMDHISTLRFTITAKLGRMVVESHISQYAKRVIMSI